MGEWIGLEDFVGEEETELVRDAESNGRNGWLTWEYCVEERTNRR